MTTTYFRKPGKTTIRHLDVTVGDAPVRVSLKTIPDDRYAIVLSEPGKTTACGVFTDKHDAERRYHGEVWTWSRKAAIAGTPVEYPREKTGRMIPCTGQAHQPDVVQDHCMVCMPRWGEVEEIAPMDFVRAEANLWDVPFPGMDSGQNVLARELEEAGRARRIEVTRTYKGGTHSYLVLRWNTANRREAAA